MYDPLLIRMQAAIFLNMGAPLKRCSDCSVPRLRSSRVIVTSSAVCMRLQTGGMLSPETCVRQQLAAIKPVVHEQHSDRHRFSLHISINQAQDRLACVLLIAQRARRWCSPSGSSADSITGVTACRAAAAAAGVRPGSPLPAPAVPQDLRTHSIAGLYGSQETNVIAA